MMTANRILAATLTLAAVAGGLTASWAAQLDGLEIKPGAGEAVQVILDTPGEVPYKVERAKNNQVHIVLPKTRLPEAFRGNGLPPLPSSEAGVTAEVQDTGDSVQIKLKGTKTSKNPVEVRFKNAGSPAPVAPVAINQPPLPKSPLAVLKPDTQEIKGLFKELKQEVAGTKTKPLAEIQAPRLKTSQAAPKPTVRRYTPRVANAPATRYRPKSAWQPPRQAIAARPAAVTQKPRIAQAPKPVKPAVVAKAPVAKKPVTVAAKPQPPKAVAQKPAPAKAAPQKPEAPAKTVAQKPVKPVKTAAKPQNLAKAPAGEEGYTLLAQEAQPQRSTREAAAPKVAQPVFTEEAPPARQAPQEGIAVPEEGPGPVAQTESPDNLMPIGPQQVPQAQLPEEETYQFESPNEAAQAQQPEAESPILERRRTQDDEKTSVYGPLLRWVFMSATLFGAFILVATAIFLFVRRRIKPDEQPNFMDAAIPAPEDYFEPPPPIAEPRPETYEAYLATQPAPQQPTPPAATASFASHLGSAQRPARQPQPEAPQPQIPQPERKPAYASRPARPQTPVQPAAPHLTPPEDYLVHPARSAKEAVRSSLSSRPSPYAGNPLRITPKREDYIGGPRFGPTAGKQHPFPSH